MILVSVQRAEDVRPARALLVALGAQFDFFLLFQRPELKQLFGTPCCSYGFDAAICVLNAQNFELVVSFSGARDPRFAGNLSLLSFFNEVGVATVEIQRELAQPGFVSSGETPRHATGIDVGYAATTLFGWEGEDGIGFLTSELPFEPLSWGPFVLVTSGDSPCAPPTQAHYQFAIAVVKLAASRPDVRFIWKPGSGDDLQPEAVSLSSMVKAYGASNLSVELSAPIDSLVAACSAGIACVSTTLIDYELREKPVLLHQAAPAEQLARQFAARRFANAAELEAAFDELLAAPERHRVHTGIGRLRVERLQSRLREAAASTALVPAWLPVALKYLPALRVAEPVINMDLQRIAGELNRLVERINVLHRSTLAYKAKKLAARARKGWTRD